MVASLTTAAWIFKTVYGDGTTVASKIHPLLDRVPRRGEFYGNHYAYAVRYANAQGQSGTFAKAQTNTTTASGVQFLCDKAVKYGQVAIDGVALASCSDKGSFYDLVTGDTDSAFEELGNSLAFDLYRTPNGTKGRRASASTNVITLSNAGDARFFAPGMTVIASANIDGSSPRVGSTTVAGVDEDAGTVTLTSAAGITSFADNDYLFRDGEQGTCVQGLGSCTPLVAPILGSDSFRGVDRGQMVSRLSGSRLSTADSTGNSIEENAGRIATKIAGLGQQVDELNLHPDNWYQVMRRLNAKVVYEAGAGADYGFQTINIMAGGAALKVFSDPDCPITEGRLTYSKGHYLKTLMKYPHVIMDDGNASLRMSTSDALEARLRSMGQYVQDKPASFGVFTI